MAPPSKPPRKPSNGTTTSDPRFSTFQTDPRYRLPRKKDTHVKVDKRFASMLEDEDFSSKAKVDRYGRKLGKNNASKGKKQLERLYDFEDGTKADGEEVTSDDDETIARELEAARKEVVHDSTYDGRDLEAEGAFASKYVGFDESSSEEEESSSEEEESEEEDAAAVAGLEGYGGEEDDDIPMGEVTGRLAVVNLDWDHIRAADLMAVAQSFCPNDGKIDQVAVYVSEFGRERIEREEFEGPPKELFKSKKSKQTAQGEERRSKRNTELFRESDSEEGADSEAGESNDEDGDLEQDATSEDEPDDAEIEQSILKHAADPTPDIDTKALRAYQLSRLRYYYAVITCSSPQTAHALYTSMDGREYLSTANFFDMRFVPDETTFDDKPSDVCTSVPAGYRPAEFVTEALTHSNVRLTWDEEDRGRKEAQKRAFTKDKDGKADIDEDDLRAYIASSSDSDSEDDGGIEVVDATQLLNGAISQPAQPAKSAQSKQSKAEAARQKMRLALGLPVEEPVTTKESKKVKDEPQVGNMQITFSSALGSSNPTKDKSAKSVFENKPEDVIEESTKDRYVRKERERKARRKEKRRLERSGQNPATAMEALSEKAGKETEPAADAGEEDDPFNDPFFEDPKAANANARAAAKKAKREAKAAAKTAEAEQKAKERSELELLMEDEGGAEFDMSEVKKAEKAAARKGKGKKGKSKRDAEGQDKDDGKEEFEIDVADPRFKGVYEDFEYAIDPSNPRFSGTQGMKKLLEEGRRKRAGDVEEVTGAGESERRDKKKRKMR